MCGWTKSTCTFKNGLSASLLALALTFQVIAGFSVNPQFISLRNHVSHPRQHFSSSLPLYHNQAKIRSSKCRHRMSGGEDTDDGTLHRASRIASTLLRAFADEISRNTRWIVSLTAAGILLWRRDAIAVSAIIGALGNAVLSKILKKVLKEERPDGAPLDPETADPGMPSSHAMSLFFFSGYLCAATVTWSGFSPMGMLASCFGLFSFATYTARWRVTAGYHTAPQVIVGSLLGGINGVAWQHFTDMNPGLVAQGDKLLASSASLPWVLCGLIVLGGGIVGWKSLKQLLPKPDDARPDRKE